MTPYSHAARMLVAKTSGQRDRYLPLWMHLMDTESVMIRLVRDWLPEAAASAMAGDLHDDEFIRVCRFLALTHDLGKATPAFQDKVAALVDGARERLGACGLTWKAVVPGASPHVLAGEELLIDARCSPAVAPSSARITGSRPPCTAEPMWNSSAIFMPTISAPIRRPGRQRSGASSTMPWRGRAMRQSRTRRR